MAAPQQILKEHWILRSDENSSAGDSPIHPILLLSDNFHKK